MTTQSTDDVIDLKELLFDLMASWKLIGVMTALGLSAGVFYAKNATPVYSTDALLQVDKKSSGVSALGGDFADLLNIADGSAQTEVEIIKSRMILAPVIDAMNLDIGLTKAPISWTQKIPLVKKELPIYEDKGVSFVGGNDEIQAWVGDFEVPEAYLNQSFSLKKVGDNQFSLSLSTKNKSPLTLTGEIGKEQTLATDAGDVKIYVHALNTEEYQLVKQSLPTALAGLNARLGVAERGKQTGILGATLQGYDPKQITDTLSRIVLSYHQYNQDKSSEETTKTLAFMEKQLPELKKKLAESEANFNNFRQANGTVDIDKEAELVATQTVAVQTKLQELELKKAELQERYTDEHPLVKQITSQIDELKKNQTDLKNRVKKIPDIQRQFVELSSDVKINSEIYLSMLKNHEQLQIVRSGQIGNVRIIDLPVATDKPIKPKKTIIVALSLVVGAFLGVLLALLKNLLRNTVKDPVSLENEVGVSVLATIPRSKKSFISKITPNKKLPLLDITDKNSQAHEAIKSLRTNLIFDLASKNGKIILITGASPGIGKSFVSANLAAAFAKAGKKTLLIDADIHLGYLHQYFGLSPELGFANYLSNKDAQKLPSLIQSTIVDELDFLATGNKNTISNDTLVGVDLVAFFEVLKETYDYIIIDSPPILANADSLALGQYVDKTLFMVRHKVSIAKQVAYAIGKLEQGGVVVDGIVLNDIVQDGIGSKSGYSYSYSYGKER